MPCQAADETPAKHQHLFASFAPYWFHYGQSRLHCFCSSLTKLTKTPLEDNSVTITTPLLTIAASYLGDDPGFDKMFFFKSPCVPRVGEYLMPHAGSNAVVVTSVVYKPNFIEHFDEAILVPTIVLQDARHSLNQ